jgi:hypothetical protein
MQPNLRTSKPGRPRWMLAASRPYPRSVPGKLNPLKGISPQAPKFTTVKLRITVLVCLPNPGCQPSWLPKTYQLIQLRSPADDERISTFQSIILPLRGCKLWKVRLGKVCVSGPRVG